MNKEKENQYVKETKDNKSEVQLNEKTETKEKEKVREEKAKGIESWEDNTPT